MKTGGLKGWVKNNKRTVALGGAALVVALLALRSRRSKNNELLVRPQYSASEFSGTAGGDDGFAAAISQLGSQFSDALDALATQQTAESERFSDAIADLFAAQQKQSEKISDLLAQPPPFAIKEPMPPVSPTSAYVEKTLAAQDAAAKQLAAKTSGLSKVKQQELYDLMTADWAQGEKWVTDILAKYGLSQFSSK